MNNRTKFALKLTLGLVVLYAAFRNFSWTQTSALLRDTNIAVACLLLACHFSLHAVTVWRWRVLLSALGKRVPFLQLLRFHFIGLYFQTLLPASTGTDIVKGYYLIPQTGADIAFASVIMGRILGLVVTAAVAVVAFLLDPGLLQRENRYSSLLFITAAGILVFIILFLAKADSWIFAHLKRIFPNAHVVSVLGRIQNSLVDYRSKSGYLLPTIAASTVMVVFMVLIHFLTFAALDVWNASFVYLSFTVPIILLITMAPVTINGLGIREALYVYFFAGTIADSHTISAFCVLNFVALILTSLAGGIVYFAHRGHADA